MARAVMTDKSLSVAAKGLYSYLAVFCNAERECYPSRERIADELGITKDYLGKLLRELVNIGVLEIVHEKVNGRFSRNRYRLTDPPCLVSPDTVSPGTVSPGTVSPGTVSPGTVSQDTKNTTFKNTTFKGDHLFKNTRCREGTSSPAPSPEKGKRFTPPTVEEVRAYCEERNNGISPERFVDYYSAQGWKLSNGQPMKDWQAAVRNWEGRDRADRSEGKASLSSANNPNKVVMPF